VDGLAGATFVVATPAQMEAVGAAVGRLLRGGDVVLLRGGLGVGKSVFARGCVRAAVGDATLDVPSPTFLLDNTYVGRAGVLVHHMDMYRLGGGAAAERLDLPRVFASEVAIIEWPQYVAAALPQEHLAVSILTEDDPAYPAAVGATLHGVAGMAQPAGTASVAQSAPDAAIVVEEDTLRRAVQMFPRGHRYQALVDKLR